MPRENENNEGPIPIGQTYGTLLRKELEKQGWNVTLNAQRARTIIALYNEICQSPSVLQEHHAVVIQVGVVDCAPRVLTARETALIEKIHPRRLQRLIRRFIHDNRPNLVKLRKHVYVPIEQFKEFYKKTVWTIKQSGISQIACFAIAPTLKKISDRSPSFAENIGIYNNAVKEICIAEGIHLMNPFDSMDEDALRKYIRQDGHHLTIAGNEEYARVLVRFVQQIQR